jgi:hypothetical protein
METKERTVTIRTTFATTPNIVAGALESSTSTTEYYSSNPFSTTVPILDNQVGDPKNLAATLGTTTVIVGGADRIQRFEDLTRLLAEERAQKRLISKSSLAKW